MEPLGDTLKRVVPVREEGIPEPVEASSECQKCKGAGYLRFDVPVEDPRFGHLMVCDCTRRDLEARRLERLLERSNLSKLQQLTFDNFILKYRDQRPPKGSADEAFHQAKQYAENPEGWLVLWGDFGSGKTHLAAAIATQRLLRGSPAVFIVVPDLLDHLRSTFSPNSDVTYDELFETVRNTPLLILDDLGTQTSTPWAQEKLYQILNHRYNQELPTVITTNLNPDEIEPRLRSRIGDARLSRLCHVASKDVRFQPSEPPSQTSASRRLRQSHRP